jgi:D-beta-D-heptose 7-phosphate kinase/D-beta-D-heptose 1-phosphate adenosyltransferase
MINDLAVLKNTHILVVGDIMLDRYYWGKVNRISPEAPVPVVKKQKTSETLGGAGNVANNLAGLGCTVTVLGICGDDDDARSLKNLMQERQIKDRLIVDRLRPTTTKTRIMARKQQIIRIDAEDAQPLSAELENRLLDVFSKILSDCRAVILSDYGKGIFQTGTLAQKMIQLARKAKLPVLVDPKGSQWERYRQATCITPNTAELEVVSGCLLEENETVLIESARGIRKQYALDWLLVTRGPQGMCLVDQQGNIQLIAAQAREVYDVSGAGDTVIATLAAALSVGEPFPDAAQTANLAAGVVVGKLGTQPIYRDELASALRFSTNNQYYPYSAAKIIGLDAGLAKVTSWKAAGDRVVFTNGCFDLLHPGHISLLYQARALGDRLIVGLNTDASVRRLKGPQRPFLSEQDRAAMLGALECVDLVIPFDEDTPLELIGLLQPDILVKGSDYRPEDVVGKSEVEGYGGCVKLVDLVDGYSTTGLSRKMRAASTGEEEA